MFVDTAPVLEKPLAQQAGLGWQGKHTNLVSRDLGSWLFLGEILTDLDLPPDEPERDHCGRCRRCLDVCPTDAFPAPYRLDARRCISYLTIEHKGPIPRRAAAADGQPDLWLRRLPRGLPVEQVRAGDARAEAAGARGPGDARRWPSSLRLDDAGFRQRFSGSPVKRIGRDRFVRNVLIAIGNSGEPGAGVPGRSGCSRDASPLVRGAAVWALARLVPAERGCASSAPDARRCEPDEEVREEWAAA